MTTLISNMATASLSMSSNSMASSDAKRVSSRQLKKREIDRRSQRLARERTKSRIAYLEGLVEEFRRQDSSGRVASLINQMAEITKERDLLTKKLNDIRKVIDSQKSGADESLNPTGPPLEEPREPAEHGGGDSRQKTPVLDNFAPSLDSLLASANMLLAPQVLPVNGAANTNDNTLVHSPTETLIPNSECPCVRHSSNKWRLANRVLSERFQWHGKVLPADDVATDDAPVRAILEGWTAVERRGNLHPSWHILRRIDETLFISCPRVERLAILRVMHTLLQFHIESSKERYARLPSWYLRRYALSSELLALANGADHLKAWHIHTQPITLHGLS